MKKEILIVLGLILVVIIVACGLWLRWYAVDFQHQKQIYETLTEDFLLEESAPTVITTEKEIVGLEEPFTSSNHLTGLSAASRLPALAALQAENPDCVGWLTIPDTPADYPLVWTPADPEYYLRRNFYGNFDSGGPPFLNGRNQPQAEDQNLIIYGHNMLDESMFKPVLQYLTPNFRETHQDIYLELDGIQYHYQVITALETNIRSPLYTYADLSDIAERENFCSPLLEETRLDAISPAEGYLTLSTCNNQGGNSRVIGIAVLIGK